MRERSGNEASPHSAMARYLVYFAAKLKTQARSEAALAASKEDEEVDTRGKTYLQLLKEKRDYKRRRQKYRARNVHITRRTPTEVSRLLLVCTYKVDVPQPCFLSSSMFDLLVCVCHEMCLWRWSQSFTFNPSYSIVACSVSTFCPGFFW